MIIPTYWAEARLQHHDRKRQVTVRRFGWSDISEVDAQAHADARVREAFDRAFAGEPLLRRERRVAYNGAEGVPIREQIVDRDGDTVITRNGYGALCLNTPNVLFADIDFEHRAGGRILLLAMASVFAITFVMLTAGFGTRMFAAGIIAFIIALMMCVPLASIWRKITTKVRGGDEKIARGRILAFVRRHPDWHVRVYRTPAGLRVLALHRVFDPREPEVKACFDALGVDPMYARMCFNQNCFRARISPKPWRIGLPRLRPPYSAAWRPQHTDLPARREWIAAYESRAEAYAACRFVESLGNAPVDPAAEAVQHLHDVFCRADQDLHIA